jgi:uncharacterized membrane protein
VLNPSPGRTRPVLVKSRSWFGDFVLVLFLCAQVLDGALTYLGVGSFGIHEGNPLVEHYMHALGPGAGLTLVKVLASGCAIVLHLLALHRILALLTLLYLSLAILPWTWLLFVMH